MKDLKTRKKRNIIRMIIAFALIISLSVVFIIFRSREPIPEVRKAVLARGDISRNYYVTANIRAGAITEHTAQVSQKVKEVKVELHQQVNEGDILIVLDREELKNKYLDAKSTREAIEKEIRAEEEAARQRSIELEQQVDEFTTDISQILSKITQLLSVQPVQTEIDPGFQDRLTQILTDPDPETLDEDIAELMEMLQSSLDNTDNSEYEQTIAELQKSISDLDSSLDALLTALNGSGIELNIDGLTDSLGGLSAYGINIQTPLQQAIAAEEKAKNDYENSVEYIYAKTPGLISEINVEPGDYTGGNQTQMDQAGLESLVSDMFIGTQTQSTSLITIYDNTIPKAVFYAGRFDAQRLEEGMPVSYEYEGFKFTGSIIREGKIAVSSDMDQLAGLGIFAEMGGTDISAQPQIEIEMDIVGEDLTALVPGFQIEASILTDSDSDVVLLPAEAMRRELEEYYVFVLNENNIVNKRSFEPGIQSELYVEAVSGLKEGDTVIVSPPADIEDGMEVLVINEG